ncbi:MAG: hypothetical protein O2899_08670, partial [Bacteroidetes bacterium]|nr:hypothetical protein [Bacteroidota bacterium]
MAAKKIAKYRLWKGFLQPHPKIGILFFHKAEAENTCVSMATKNMNDSWTRVVNQIQSIWSNEEFGEAEMKKARGKLNKMVELIHEKTGEPR